MSFPGAKKIVKKEGEVTEVEQRVANELASLEASNAALKDLKALHIAAAKEVDVEGKKAILVFVPFPLLGDFRKIQTALVEELEKKLSGAHVILLANRTMLSAAAWSRNKKLSGVRPRSRSLKAVHEALLDDLVYPTEITGKRTRVRTDGSRLLRVHLDSKGANAVEGKLDTFRAVYKRLTSKDVVFEFPTHH